MIKILHLEFVSLREETLERGYKKRETCDKYSRFKMLFDISEIENKES